ncbi:hypothetical protein EVAR_664_1 [Eumeta japonica]|uniref:Uncharacterized protein n=1 Tax=Eumeta variegata TaxID=151549 RepID=A0A4C1SC94_EUMVA|nr:hypothetical protein EVAR_664_1 [Eumeta japonica]
MFVSGAATLARRTRYLHGQIKNSYVDVRMSKASLVKDTSDRVSKSSGIPFSSPSPHPIPIHQPTTLFIKYLITTQETSNALVTLLGLRMSMGDSDYLLFEISTAVEDRNGNSETFVPDAPAPGARCPEG